MSSSMRGGKSKPQPRGPFRHRRRPDRDDEKAFLLEHARGGERRFRLAEHERHDRALRLGQAERAGEGPRLGERQGGQVGIALDDVERGDRGRNNRRRQAGREEKSARARLQSSR